MWRRPCKLFIFDLDGTLIDSQDDISKSVNLALDRLGLRRVAESRIAGFVGEGVQKLIQRTLRESTGAAPKPELVSLAIPVYLEEYGQHLLDSTRLYAGVREALCALSWAQHAVISNKPEAFSRRILEALEIAGQFCAILGGDSVDKRKPDPAPLQRVMIDCRALPSETVMVGDSRIDIQAGKSAGTITCGVLGGFGTREELEAEKCDLIVENLTELVRHFHGKKSGQQAVNSAQ